MYAVVERMLTASNPGSYRGYPTPNRYWDAPDGQRYWMSRMMINRCWPDSVEPLRLVRDSAKPVEYWDGPPMGPKRHRPVRA
jgi:hypothetical protein